MREIKFRAWNKSTKTMADLQKITPFATSLPGLFIPSDPDVILMQFTGLEDKDHKEIYEGDIIRLPCGPGNSIVRSVVWYMDGWRVRSAPDPCGCFHCAPHKPNQRDWSRSKVIGNIHENPKLLKASQ